MSNSNPREEIRNFVDQHEYNERGAYFLDGLARCLLRVIDRYKENINQTEIIYLKADIEEIINNEIREAIDAVNKNLKSKQQRITIARERLNEKKNTFFALYDEAN